MHFKLFLTTLCLSFFSTAQEVDLNNYEPLKSQGPVPETVTSLLSEVFEDKKDEKIEGVGYSKSQQYYQETNYALKEILNSGLILFNDPITEYVEEVGNSIIQGDSDLEDIEFFSIRTNIVNAFVTPQGNVFVTQGLIAQLENEAQLAYILAHEISHYKLNHNVNKYKERIEVMRGGGSYSRRIKKLSNYSREKEYSADSLGIHYYQKAGYAKSELYKVFDVLAYSYLPFELREFPKDYFNTSNIYVPEELFTDEYPEISFDEDYDDSKSSHPNIESRREKIAEWIEDKDSWGDVVNHLSNERFIKVRKIARFEAIRNDLYDVRPENALYNIFLLEDSYPENEYLETSKAKAWSQLISLREDGVFFRQLSRSSNVQGEPHRLVKFLRELDEEALYTIALRTIVDIKNKYPESPDLQGLYDFVLLELAKNVDFDLDDYKSIKYQDALSRFNEKRDSLAIEDSLAQTEQYNPDKSEEKVSKYDKIRSQKDNDIAVSVKDSFDIEQFYIYGLADVIDSSFIESFKSFEKRAEEIQEREDFFDELSYRDRKKYRKEFQKDGMKRDIHDIVLLTPHVRIQNRYGEVNIDKSIQAEEYVSEELNSEEGSWNSVPGLTVQMLSVDNSEISRLEMIQGQNIAINSIRLMTYFEDVELYPVEYEELAKFKKDFGSNYIGLFLAENYKNSPIKASMLLSVFIPPLFAVQFANNLMKRNSTDYTFAVFDLSTDRFDVEVIHNSSLYGGRTKNTVLSLLNYYLTELPKVYED
tara:strand:- start:79585 stop:81864 length:2280 start_codon:yes stop_codon:yes gene_type:complete